MAALVARCQPDPHLMLVGLVDFLYLQLRRTLVVLPTEHQELLPPPKLKCFHLLPAVAAAALLQQRVPQALAAQANSLAVEEVGAVLQSTVK